MKMFWALVGVIAIAAVVMLAAEFSGSGSTPAAPSPAPAAKGPSPALAEAAKPELPASVPVNAPAEEPMVKSTPAVQFHASGIAPDKALDTASPTPTNPASPRPPKVVETPSASVSEKTKETAAPDATPSVAPAQSTENENLLIKMREEIERERAAAAAKREAEAKLAAAPTKDVGTPAPGGAQETPGAAPSEKAAESAPFGGAKVEMKPDGSMLVDGKYTVSGQGTKEQPYKITWDHLVSAERDYAPKEGKKTIPARIMALDDKWVEITGYVAFPLMSNETDELLSMMNQWDGCCIGIPPTPYDAIEVRLSNVVSGDTRLTTYGMVTGKFKVDAHLVGGWLVGLYVIDQGKLSPKAYGGVAP